MTRRRLTAILAAISLCLWLTPMLHADNPEPEPFERHFSPEDRGRIPASELLAAMRDRRRIDIEYAIIEGPLNAVGLPIDQLSVTRSTFDDDANFVEAIFEGDAIFDETIFKGGATFRFATFESKATFRYAIFEGNAKFEETVFEGDANFVETIFEDEARFKNASFCSALFVGATFRDSALFVGSSFKSDAIFWGSLFEDSADFYSARFENDADFSGIRYGKDFGLAGVLFKGIVHLNDVSAVGMVVTWAQLEGRLDTDDRFYATLTDNFEDRGRFDDADKAFYAHRVASRPMLDIVGLVLVDWTCGYGVKPFRTLAWCLGVVLICALLFSQKGAIQPRDNPPGYDLRGYWDRLSDACYFSLVTFTRGGSGDWSSTEKPLLRFRGRQIGSYRMLAAIEGLIGWILLTLFIVALAKVWVR